MSMMGDKLDFETWFHDLVTYAFHKSLSHVIDGEQPEAYKEYYEDGNTFQEVLDMELRYH